MLGVVACLAGGAQLHSRANIEAIGGRIDTGTLAEDTVTTFQTQLAGHRAIFEPHAAVSAEEPMAIAGLWRQRLRWARGNLQVTGRFRGVWFRPGTPGGLGSVSFGLIWFGLAVYVADAIRMAARRRAEPATEPVPEPIDGGVPLTESQLVARAESK